MRTAAKSVETAKKFSMLSAIHNYKHDTNYFQCKFGQTLWCMYQVL